MDKKICLITYDGELLFHNGCRPICGLALFEGFKNQNAEDAEKAVIEFIIDHRTNVTRRIFNDLFEEISENLDREKFKTDPVFSLLAQNDEDFDILPKESQMIVIEKFIKESKKFICAFALVDYNENLFSILRSFDRDVWSPNSVVIFNRLLLAYQLQLTDCGHYIH